MHYALITAVLLLLSRPVMASAGDRPLAFFDWRIPAPLPINSDAFSGLRAIHRWSAGALTVGVGLHICGVLKHVIFDREDVFDRIMVAARPSSDSS